MDLVGVHRRSRASTSSLSADESPLWACPQIKLALFDIIILVDDSGSMAFEEGASLIPFGS